MNPTKIPEPILPKAHVETRQIGALWLQFKQGGPDYVNPNLPPQTRFILGFPIPLFQRPLVWTIEQKTRFIESIWNQFHLGVYMINEIGGLNCYEHPLNDALIDGQQRLKAIEDYWNNEYPVFGYLWKDLTEFDQRRFRETGFARAVVRIDDEALLKHAYNLLNFAGTAHTAAQKA